MRGMADVPRRSLGGDRAGEEADGAAEGRQRTKFAVVVPALNEEEAIGSTLSRALASREQVVGKTPVGEMVVIFVNDGSTDGTQEIADRYAEVVKIHFPENRGYGAAIKAGFGATDAELVGFMDADGTCDPVFFVQLINRLYKTKADVVLGGRLNPESKMPVVRRLGNWVFARLIGVISGQSLTDCASGMRVIRRGSLRRMVPLPDGLHFTPVMSCVAMLDPALRIEEVPMPYEERVGRSKLSVFKDGIRFLSTILFAGACYNPIKVLVALGLLFCLVGLAVSYVAGRCVEPLWPAAALMGAFVLVLAQAGFVGVLCHQLLFTLMGPVQPPGWGERLLQMLVRPKPLVIAGVLLFILGLAAAACAIATGPSQAVVLWTLAALCIAVGGWLALAGVILRVIWAVHRKVEAAGRDPFARASAAESSA